MGMFYHWPVNLAGPFPQSKYGSYYIMVMIEHFSNAVQRIRAETYRVLR